MEKFWELFQESVIVQSLVTLTLVITICAMFLMSKPIPELLGSITLLVLGFWFGAKSQHSIVTSAKEASKAAATALADARKR
jgi:hypothetical protein